MTVTIQQIADRAGVSAGTVSRILNGLNKENRPANIERAQRVRRIAAELQYRPNTAARIMTTGRFHSMAFLSCSELGYDWFPLAMLHGIQRALDRQGCRLVMSQFSHAELTDTQSPPWVFRESAVDAILLHIDAKMPEGLEMFRRSHPGRVVLLNEKLQTDAVYPDELMGGRFVAERLLGLGHRRIGFLRLMPSNGTLHYSVSDRLGGVLATLADAGLGAHAIQLHSDRYDIHRGNGVEIAGEFLDAHPGLTAVVCYGMHELATLGQAAAARGMRLPDDLRLIVFADRAAHSHTSIAHDTLIVPFAQLGERAVTLANELIDGPAGERPAQPVPYSVFFDADSLEHTEVPF